MERVLLGVLAGLCAWPGVVGATVVKSADGTLSPQPYQAWLDEAYVPGPDVDIALSLGRCPLPLEESCATATTPAAGGDTTYTIYLSPTGQTQKIWLHEVGHIVDYTMQDWAREKFRDILHDHRAWRKGPNPLHEQFADAYSLCARKKRLRQHFGASFAYSPTPYQHRKVCSLIWDAVEPPRIIA